MASELQETK